MNSYQKMARQRLARRFTQGDGVLVPHAMALAAIHAARLKAKRPDAVDCVGRIVSCWAGDYFVELRSPVQCQGDQFKTVYVVCKDSDLQSMPTANRGKYGGPTRGGSAGGWIPGRSYSGAMKRAKIGSF